MLSDDDISAGYRALLGREPESQHVIEAHKSTGSLRQFIADLASSTEYQMRHRPGPLWGYAASYDPVAVVLSHENVERLPVAGHRVNFLGVAVNVAKFFPDMSLENVVEPIPIPNNWHTDIAELSAALRAVDLAGETFSIIELGCGWGCWMNITGMAARRRGKSVSMIGVEGDPGHIAFARESLATNGFATRDYKLFWGIAAADSGVAFFPIQRISGQEWGLEAKLRPSTQEAEALRGSGRYEELPIFSLPNIAEDVASVDLLHIDIQGAETEVIAGALEFLNEKVRYIVVGTHSRKIDGDLLALLSADGGWALEIERPAIFTIDNGRPTLRIDGVQGWRNLRL